jgi:hypothetical protein
MIIAYFLINQFIIIYNSWIMIEYYINLWLN